MRWHCAVGEACEGQVRRVKRRGRWVGSNGGARRDLNRNEMVNAEPTAESVGLESVQ